MMSAETQRELVDALQVLLGAYEHRTTALVMGCPICMPPGVSGLCSRHKARAALAKARAEMGEG